MTPPDNDGPTTQDRVEIKRALVSVYDKSGLEDLVRGLDEAGVELVSTGGSAKLIADLGLPVTKVEDLTGFPECLDGRVKTLHPKVHAGILADRRLPTHVAQLEELGVAPFDLVVSNLYPFTQTVMSGATPDECVEQIDIGGPSMVRAAAKNHPSVAIVTSPERYDDVLAALGEGGFTLEQRKRLAAEAFVHTATYDVHVASWMGNVLTDTSDGAGFPAWVGATWDRAAVLRYGENPHQSAALYHDGFGPAGLAQAAPAARQGDVLQQLRRRRRGPPGGVRLRRARGGDHQARQPVRHRGRGRRGRGAPQGPRVRPGLRVRRRDRGQPAGVGGDGPAGRRGVHRGRGRAGVRGRRGRDPPGQEERPPPRVRAAAPRRRRDALDLRRSADAAARPRRRRRRRPVELDARHGRGRLRRGAGRPGVRVDGLPRREVQRDPARQRWRLGRHRHGPGQPGRLLQARGRPGGGAGRRLGRRLRRVLPLRGRPADPDRRRREGDRPARRLGARRADHRGRQGRPASRCTSPAPGTLPTERMHP